MTGVAPSKCCTRPERTGVEAQAEPEALVPTTEPEIRHFKGFLARIWEDPTWLSCAILSAKAAPRAGTLTISGPVMQQTGLTDIRTWRSPDDMVLEPARDVGDALGTVHEETIGICETDAGHFSTPALCQQLVI